MASMTRGYVSRRRDPDCRLVLLVESRERPRYSYEVILVDFGGSSGVVREPLRHNLPHQASLQMALKRREAATCRREGAAQVLHQLSPGLGGGRRRWEADSKELRSDVRLSRLQAAPEAVAARQRQRATGGAFPGCFATRCRHDGLDEPEERLGPHHKTSEDVVEQDGEGAAAARTTGAIRAKEPSTTNDPVLRPLRVASQQPVSDERFNPTAVRTRPELCLAETLLEVVFAGNESLAGTHTHGRSALRVALYFRIRPAGKKRDKPDPQEANTTRVIDPDCGCARAATDHPQLGENPLDVVTGGRGSTPTTARTSRPQHLPPHRQGA